MAAYNKMLLAIACVLACLAVSEARAQYGQGSVGPQGGSYGGNVPGGSFQGGLSPQGYNMQGQTPFGGGNFGAQPGSGQAGANYGKK